MDLSNAKYILPNMFTLASVFTGFYSILITLRATSPEELQTAAWLIAISLIFDAFDGRVARATKTQSAFGTQLDSLADAIAFGVAPAVLVYRWGLEPLGTLGVFFAFVFTACGIMRLARFNVIASSEEGPSRYFLGLPIPPAAATLISVVLAHTSLTGDMHANAPWAVVMLLVPLALLMVSNARYRTFKKVKLRGPAGIAVALLLIIAVVVSVQFKPSVAFAGLSSVYVVLGITESILGLRGRLSGRLRRSRAISGDEVVEELDED